MSPSPHKAAIPTTKRGLVGWVLFDWATQPFYTLVVTFLFAPYFVNGFMDDPAHGQSLWAYATATAQLIAAALAPVLGAIADAGLPRKPWIAGFSVLLVAGLSGLWFAVQAVTHHGLQLLVIDAGVLQDLAHVGEGCFQQLEQQVGRDNLGTLTADAQGRRGFQGLA